MAGILFYVLNFVIISDWAGADGNDYALHFPNQGECNSVREHLRSQPSFGNFSIQCHQAGWGWAWVIKKTLKTAKEYCIHCTSRQKRKKSRDDQSKYIN